jgi:hypothetical protein
MALNASLDDFLVDEKTMIAMLPYARLRHIEKIRNRRTRMDIAFLQKQRLL